MLGEIFYEQRSVATEIGLIEVPISRNLSGIKDRWGAARIRAAPFFIPGKKI